MGNPYYNPDKNKPKGKGSAPKGKGAATPKVTPQPTPKATPKGKAATKPKGSAGGGGGGGSVPQIARQAGQQVGQIARQAGQAVGAVPGIAREMGQAAGQDIAQKGVQGAAEQWGRQVGNQIRGMTGMGAQGNGQQPYVTPTMSEWRGAQSAAEANRERMPTPVPFSQTFEGQRIAQGLQPYVTSAEMFPWEMLDGGQGDVGAGGAPGGGGGGVGGGGDGGGGWGGGGGGGDVGVAAAPAPTVAPEMPATNDLPGILSDIVKAKPGEAFKIPPVLQKWLAKSGLYGNLLSILQQLGIMGVGVMGPYGFESDFTLPMDLANIDIEALMSGLDPAAQLSLGMLLEQLIGLPEENTPAQTQAAPTQQAPQLTIPTGSAPEGGALL